jgi:hypothetical protein
MQDSNLVALVEQLAHMNADQFIVARVSSKTKARLHAFAEREQLSESALLRRLVEFVLLKAGYAPIITETPTGARPRRTARLMIRLCTDDQILLGDRAAARGMAPATYVSVLTRAHLRSLAPLPIARCLTGREVRDLLHSRGSARMLLDIFVVSMIGINQLRWSSAQPHVAQPHSKDFPIVSRYFFDSCFFCRALLSEEGQTA